MKWMKYDLYIEVVEEDELMQPIASLKLLEQIECVVTYKFYTIVEGDLVYRKLEPSAITRYKDLTLNQTYYLKNTDHTYKINSFNKEGRFAQLLLREIISQ